MSTIGPYSCPQMTSRSVVMAIILSKFFPGVCKYAADASISGSEPRNPYGLSDIQDAADRLSIIQDVDVLSE